MEFEEKKIKKLMNKSFLYLLSLTANYDLSREISSIALYQLCLNYESVRNPDAWIIKVSSNLFKKNYKKYLREEEIIERKKELVDCGTDDTITSFNQICEYLENDELSFLLKYFSKSARSELIQEYDMSNNSIRKKVSILKKKIKAKYNMDKGYHYGNDLILPEINQSITSFLRSLKKALDERNIKMMKNYLAYVNEEEIELLKSISVVKKYDFRIVNDKRYSIFLVYQDDAEDYLCIEIVFSIQNKHLRVLSIKDYYSTGKVIKCEKTVSKISSILCEAPRARDGRKNIRIDEIVGS